MFSRRRGGEGRNNLRLSAKYYFIPLLGRSVRIYLAEDSVFFVFKVNTYDLLGECIGHRRFLNCGGAGILSVFWVFNFLAFSHRESTLGISQVILKVWALGDDIQVVCASTSYVDSSSLNGLAPRRNGEFISRLLLVAIV